MTRVETLKPQQHSGGFCLDRQQQYLFCQTAGTPEGQKPTQAGNHTKSY